MPASQQPHAIADGPPWAAPAEFVVRNSGDGREQGVFAARSFSRSSLVARISGVVVHARGLHTLQMGEGLHMYDMDFAGLLLHSCAPNVHVDMQRLEVWALRDIRPGEALCMDYTTTEDVLHRQFPCLCGAPACRRWITGYREPINGEGLRYLQGGNRDGALRDVV